MDDSLAEQLVAKLVDLVSVTIVYDSSECWCLNIDVGVLVTSKSFSWNT